MYRDSNLEALFRPKRPSRKEKKALLTCIPGVDSETAEELIFLGYDNLEKLAKANAEDISAKMKFPDLSKVNYIIDEASRLFLRVRETRQPLWRLHRFEDMKAFVLTLSEYSQDQLKAILFVLDVIWKMGLRDASDFMLIKDIIDIAEESLRNRVFEDSIEY